VFLINVPIVIVGLIFILRIVPETRNPTPRKLDVMGLVISATGLILFVYGIIEASSTRDWLAPSVVIPGTIGLIIIAVFLWMESRSDHASFDVSLFRNRGYSVALTAVSLSFFAMSGITFTLPFYLQVLRGYSVLQAGLMFLPFAVGQLLAAPRSAAMVKRFGYRAVMTVGLVLVAVAMLALARVPIDAPLWGLILVFFIFGLGMGNVIAPGSTVLQNVLPLARAGAGSAVQNTVRQVAGALGVAVIGTILANQYAANLSTVIDKVPAQFPPAAKDAALQSVVAASAILDNASAQGVPATVIDPLRQGAFEAYLSAAHLTSLISMIVIVIAAVAVFFLLPQITPPEQGAHAPGAPAADPTDAMVQHEVEEYAAELAAEMDGPDDHRRP
jgi:DHA2 family multidrug resistance protein-like MFS transporter